MAGRNGEMLWRAGMERCCGGQEWRDVVAGRDRDMLMLENIEGTC